MSSELERWCNLPNKVTASWLGPRGYKKLKAENIEPEDYIKIGGTKSSDTRER